MEYRDEMIRRLKQEGSWQSLTTQAQGRLEQLSNEQARKFLVLQDQWTLGDQDAVNLVGVVSLIRMIHSFKGSLVELKGENMGRLSEAGRLLAEFLIELANKGLTAEEIQEGFDQLNPLVIAALITSYNLMP
jgi:hypothetical protein